MMKAIKTIIASVLITVLIFALCACGAGTFSAPVQAESAGQWNIGYGRRQILPDKNSTQPLYIAGYNSGVEITGVLDYCQARAVWLDTGG